MYLNLEEPGMITEDEAMNLPGSVDFIKELDFRKNKEDFKKDLLTLFSDYLSLLDTLTFIKFPRNKTLSEIYMNNMKDYLILFKNLSSTDRIYYQNRMKRLITRRFNGSLNQNLGFMYSEYLLFYLSDYELGKSLDEMIALDRIYNDSRIRKNYFWLLDYIKNLKGVTDFMTLFTYNRESLKSINSKIKEDERAGKEKIVKNFKIQFNNYSALFEEESSLIKFHRDKLVQNLYIHTIFNERFLKTYGEKIDVIMLTSPKGEIEIRRKDNHYYILWDNSYWNLFESFLHTVIAVANKKSGRTKAVPGLNENIPEFFLYNFYSYLSQKLSFQRGEVSEAIEKLFSRIFNFTIHLNLIQEQDKKSLRDCAKTFIFFEELEVIHLDINSIEVNFKFCEVIIYLKELLEKRQNIITNQEDDFIKESHKILFEPEFDFLRREIFFDFSSFLKLIDTLEFSRESHSGQIQHYQNSFRSSLLGVQFENFISEITNFTESLEEVLSTHSINQVITFYQEYEKDLKERWYYHKLRQELFSTLGINYISQVIKNPTITGQITILVKKYCKKNENLLKIISFIEEEILKQVVDIVEKN